MKKYVLYLSFISIIAVLFSCAGGLKNIQPEGPDPLVSHIDSSIIPGNDFFDYANGTWFKENPIPPSEVMNGIWQIIQDTINAQIKQVCLESAALENAEKGSNKQKIGDLYKSGMDSVSLNAQGIKDIKDELDKIDGIKSKDGIAEVAAGIQAVSGSPMFSFWVSQDDRNSDKYAINIWQGGLTLPDKQYYFADDARTKMIREKFTAYLKNLFVIMGYGEKQAEAAASETMKMETDLAKASRNREDTRDPLHNYTKIAFARLKDYTPSFDWTAFMKDVGLQNVDTVILGQPEFLQALDKYIGEYSLDAWKDYLKIHLIVGLSSYMDDRTYMETFDFFGKTLRGMEEPRPRWKRVVGETDGDLGDLIGQVYVAEYLPAGTKEKLQEIGSAIRDVYAERIKKLDWMTDVTKEKALQKLAAMNMKLGYPDKWKDLSSLEISRQSYVQNVMNANKWWFNYRVSKFGKPVDRSEWHMEPQTYNAYYSPSNNEIVVPGCNIMVPGYERKMADDAILYAVIGATFGHEMTHGFDDQGSKYDLHGNLNNWWTPEDSIRFFDKTKILVQQYDAYIPVDSLHINGKLTLGENIADLGGVRMAYQAFTETPQYKNNEIIGGVNPEKRFFLGYALAWMVNMRPEAIANRVRSDEHSPAKYRVIGPLSDMTEFYNAWDVKPGEAMWRPDSLRVNIW